MSDIALSPEGIPGADRGSSPVVHIRLSKRLVFFPDESVAPRQAMIEGTKRLHQAFGSIYAIEGGQVVAKIPACGGPRGREEHLKDGHSMSETPAGHYVLGPKHHHVSKNWLRSAIPWGAEIRANQGERVQYRLDSDWKPATGRDGIVTKVLVDLNARAGITIKTRKQWLKVEEIARAIFLVDTNLEESEGPYVNVWTRNDFGEWAFNLRLAGARTPFYVHTTPDNENNPRSHLGNSHGCIHVMPEDRDNLMAMDFLVAGASFEVRRYGQIGPP